MDIGKIKNTIDGVGRKVNGFAAYHNFDQWQIWLAIALVIALVTLIIIVIC